MSRVDFERIARENLADLYRCALKLTRSSAQAWDLVQDTFERSLTRFPPHLPPEKVRSWLVVIMRNLFLDAARSARSQVRLWRARANPERPDPVHPLEEEEACARRSERFRAEDVRACLADLAPVLRQSFELHAFGGLSYRDIAALLDLRVTTVGTRILRARRRLCELLLARAGGSEPQGADPLLTHLAAPTSSLSGMGAGSQTGEGKRLAGGITLFLLERGWRAGWCRSGG